MHCICIPHHVTTKINIIINTRCAGLASKLSLDFALMHKERVKAGEISRMILVIINIVMLIIIVTGC